MARNKRWWSGVIAEQKKWFLNYPKILEKYRDELEVTDDELEAAQNDAAMFIFICKYTDSILAYYKYAIKYKKMILKGKAQKDAGKLNAFEALEFPDYVLTGLLARTFSYIIILKLRGGYNDNIGLALMVIGADPDFFDPEEYIANGNATITADGIQIKFKKGKAINGMEIKCQRGKDPLFYYLDKITIGTGKFIDKRPNLFDGEYETRTYIMRAYIGNDLIGKPSPEFKVTCLIKPLSEKE